MCTVRAHCALSRALCAQSSTIARAVVRCRAATHCHACSVAMTPSQPSPIATPEGCVATLNDRHCHDKKFSVVTDLHKFSVAIEEDWSPVATLFLCHDTRPPCSVQPWSRHCPRLQPYAQRALSRPWSPNPSPSPVTTRNSCRDTEPIISVGRVQTLGKSCCAHTGPIVCLACTPCRDKEQLVATEASQRGSSPFWPPTLQLPFFFFLFDTL